jgi:predicted  nucleic acid-binding Zn-ribbon protein
LLKETEKQIKKIELDIKSKEEEILDYQAKEHMVKSNEEYRALLDQIERAKQEEDELEEKEIELLYKIDELKKQIESKKIENEAKEKQIKNKIREIEDEFSHIDDKLEILVARRNDLTKKIDPGLYNQYEKIRRIKGHAVAYVVDGSCSGCSAVLPLQLVITLKSTGEIGRCENCGRLLVYIPEKDV